MKPPKRISIWAFWLVVLQQEVIPLIMVDRRAGMFLFEIVYRVWKEANRMSKVSREEYAKLLQKADQLALDMLMQNYQYHFYRQWLALKPHSEEFEEDWQMKAEDRREMKTWLATEEIQGLQKRAIQHPEYAMSKTICEELLTLVETRAKEHARRVYGPKQEV